MMIAHSAVQYVGVESMLHMTCVGSSKDDISGYLDKAKKMGLRNILALRGDLPNIDEEWVHHPDKRLDHVVLGRGGPGGGWQSLAGSAGGGDMLTVSLGGWMELPALSMEAWQQGEAEMTGRASVATVSQYYQVSCGL